MAGSVEFDAEDHLAWHIPFPRCEWMSILIHFSPIKVCVESTSVNVARRSPTSASASSSSPSLESATSPIPTTTTSTTLMLWAAYSLLLLTSPSSSSSAPLLNRSSSHFEAPTVTSLVIEPSHDEI